MAEQLFRALDLCIAQELEIYERYVQLLEVEKSLVIAAKTDELAKVTAERERLIDLMKESQDTRFSLMRSTLGEPETLGRQKAPPPVMKLTAFIKKYCSPREIKLLLPKVEKLRHLAMGSQRKSLEFSQVVGFSLTMVSGLASILWSATKTVVRSYTAAGNLTESVHDTRSRKAGVLKEV